ncbi:MAG: PmoA family protein [Candidatus Sumerlaeota bacterium]|nr:PmoA family protein [Candidatus Sumerlaeota bacterium]
MLARVCARAVICALAVNLAIAANAETTITLNEETGITQAMRDGRVFFEYVTKNVPRKPYVRTLCTPSGVNILRDNVADHLHHHGLMFACNVNGVDFWSETPKCGWQMTRVQMLCMGWIPYGFIDWTTTPGAPPVLKENREITVHASMLNSATVLTWRTTFHIETGTSVALTGASYHGLGMRFVQSMDKSGTFFNADRKPGVRRDPKRSEWNIDGPAWCAYTAPVEGKPVTVAMFNDPKNPRPPSWFTMQEPVAYLSGTISLDVQPFVLEKGILRSLRYGVALWDGKIEEAKIADAYKAWADGLGK